MEREEAEEEREFMRQLAAVRAQKAASEAAIKASLDRMNMVLVSLTDPARFKLAYIAMQRHPSKCNSRILQAAC